MKRRPFPRPSPTSQMDTRVTDESQVVAVQRAPCRNRTCNLMIKSHFKGTSLARTGAVQLAPSASKLVELVPHTYPNRARRFHDNSPVQSPLDLLYGNPVLALAGLGKGGTL